MNTEEFNDEINVVIEKLVYGGYALARYAGKIYMVKNAYPGEFIKIVPKQVNKNLIFADLKEVIQPSPQRVNTQCSNFPNCGGCQWLDYDYNAQIEAKTEIIKEQLRRIGKIDNSLVRNTIDSDIKYGYRNRMEFAFQNYRSLKLGLKKADSNEVLDIKKCPISPNPFDNIKNRFKDLVEKLELQIYNPKSKKGILKHLVLRRSFSKNQNMIILVTHTEYLPYENEIKQFFKKNFHPYSLIHLMNSSDKIVLRGPYRTLLGEGVLLEEFDNFTFQIPPISFFQSNYNVTDKLLKSIVSYLKDKVNNQATLLDLYSGVGLFSIYLSPLFKHIEAVENSKISVKAAISNSHINSINNIRFILANSKKYLQNNVSKKFDFAIVDPPRKGLENKEIELLSSAIKKSLIYVSCDPSTLARDLKSFVEKGFNIKIVQPFDMFPHSYHIESVAILEK